MERLCDRECSRRRGARDGRRSLDALHLVRVRARVRVRVGVRIRVRVRVRGSVRGRGVRVAVRVGRSRG